jgi:hypothetical protein
MTMIRQSGTAELYGSTPEIGVPVLKVCQLSHGETWLLAGSIDWSTRS